MLKNILKNINNKKIISFFNKKNDNNKILLGRWNYTRDEK